MEGSNLIATRAGTVAVGSIFLTNPDYSSILNSFTFIPLLIIRVVLNFIFFDENIAKGTVQNKKYHYLWKKSIIFLTPPPLDNLDFFEFGKKLIFDDPPPRPKLGKI